MSAEREEYLRLKAAQNVHEMSPERAEYLRLKSEQEPAAPSTTFASMRPEPPVQPAVSTAVSPEFAKTPDPHFGILPSGTGEKFEKALPQWPVTEDMGAGQKALRTAGNLALGAAKFPVRMGTGVLEEPYKVPEALAKFVPTVAERIMRAIPGVPHAIPTSTKEVAALNPRYGMMLPPYTREERKAARRELMEEPFDVALLAVPKIISRIKKAKSKTVTESITDVAEATKPVVEAVKAKKVAPKPAKEPWEMTRREWWQSIKTERHPAIKTRDFKAADAITQNRAREIMPDWDAQKSGFPTIDKLHRISVEDAIGRGKLVSPKVLKDYPDLVKKPAPQLLQGEKGKVVGKKEVMGEQPIIKQPKIIGLNKAEVERIRRHTELDKLPDAQKRTFVETLERAKADKLDESALETADYVLKAKKQITDAEHAGMVIKAAKLADEYDAVVKNASNYLESGNKAAAQMERSRAEAVIDQLDKLTEATKSGRREVARALSIGRMMINRESYDLAHVIQRARVAKGRKLTPKETARIESLVAEHAKLEKRIADLERKGATLPQLEQVQLRLEIQKKKIRGGIERLVPWTPRSVFGETVNTLRTLKATADMSGVLRQGLVLSITRPKLAAKSFGKAFVATFSKHKSEQIDFAIRRMDQHYLRERAGLHLSEFGEGARLAKREEYFMAQVIERVPVVGTIVKASNRNMATFLNLMRVGAFDQFLLKYPNASRVELKAWANWVNIASGRGNLGRARSMANELSLVVFAPRFAVSRVQTPFMMLKYLKHPAVRKEIARDMVGLVGLGTTALSLAALSGFEVGLNPREADFGKIRIGDTRIDMWAGLQQPARLIARIGVATTDRIGISGKQLADSEKDFDPVQAVGRFAGYKLAPSITLPRELMTGETMVGEPRTPLKSAAHTVIPMVYEDIADAYRVGGVPRAGLSAGLAFFGVGVNTYGDSQSRVRRDIKSAMRKGNYTEARTKAYQWNMEHPDRMIHSVRTATDTLNIATGGSTSRSRQRPGARQ